MTKKANWIHFWCVDSEFTIKNLFRNWTSELGCIWYFFLGKLGYFWLFLVNPDIQVTVNIQQNSVYLQKLVVASAEVLEKSQIFQKCAKCTLTLMSNFDYKFRFYTSKLNEICLHCHCLYFSSMILSFGQGVITLIERFYIGKRNEKWIQNRLSVFYTIYTKQNSKKKDVAHNKGKIKVSLVVYYVETFECWL